MNYGLFWKRRSWNLWITCERKAGRQIISKRISDDGKPGSLRYEAESLKINGFNHYTLLRTLEGMCHIGLAKEIDDSHYMVL